MSQPIAVSVVIPLYNEAPSLNELHDRLVEVLTGTARTYELLFVNDGSEDDSAARLEALAEANPSVGVIELRRNFGKAAALEAGFRLARGQIVVTLDADLQDEPAEIPHLIEKLESGFDVVCGWKRVRRDGVEKRWPSKIFNWLAGLMSGLKLHDMNCGLKAFRREAIAGLPLYGEMHRFIPALVHWRGYRVTEIAVEHHPRKHGRSKYGSSRLVKGLFDLITVLLTTRYVTRPLHLFGGAGLIFAVVGFAILLYLTIWKLVDIQGHSIGNRPILFLGLLMMMIGVQFVCTGLLAELLVRRSDPDPPAYVVRHTRKPAAE